MKNRRFISIISVLAFLVLVGQGCPGIQQTADVESDTQMEADLDMMEDGDDSMTEDDSDTTTEDDAGEAVTLNTGSETAFGLALPEGATDVNRGDRGTGDNVQTTIVSFTMPAATVKEVHNYFLNEVKKHNWNIENDIYVGFRNTGVITAFQNSAELNIDTSVNPRTNQVAVEMVRLLEL